MKSTVLNYSQILSHNAVAKTNLEFICVLYCLLAEWPWSKVLNHLSFSSEMGMMVIILVKVLRWWSKLIQVYNHWKQCVTLSKYSANVGFHYSLLFCNSSHPWFTSSTPEFSEASSYSKRLCFWVMLFLRFKMQDPPSCFCLDVMEDAGGN